MNRNVESHFAQLPRASISRSRFDRSQDVKMTFNVGELIPFYVDEVLPGDTFEITTSKVVRLQTLLTPVMDNIYLDTYFFFVPNRLVWDHWKQFMGESNKAWLPTVTYNVPRIGLVDDTVAGDGAVKTGDILDYMGVPVGVSYASSSSSPKFSGVNALPLRAYQLIYNDWFRDENLIDPINIYTGDTNYKYAVSTVGQHKPYKVAKYHDYFTSALPSRAKLASLGDPFSAGSVAAPIYGYGDDIPVITADKENKPASGVNMPALRLLRRTGASPTVGKYVHVTDTTTDPNYPQGMMYEWSNETTAGDYPAVYPGNLFASISNHPMIGAIDIVSLRYAFQVQKFYEALARSGSRYTEILEGLFSVKSPDARLQRPEYLGGNRVPISIHQITNQSQGENDFLGDLGAMSLTTDKHGDFVKSFVEHGFVIGVCCARYDHSYPQGLERFWFRKDRLEYYWPQFANLSEQVVYNGEIYLDGSNLDAAEQAFGFQEAWADYRYKPNKVMAEMRPGIQNTLDSWHFADYYTQQPVLSQGWIEEDRTNIDRTLAVTSQVSNQIFCDIYIQNYSTRPMPLYSIPGFADHH